MNNQNNHSTNPAASVVIEDLTPNEVAAQTIKGGPQRIADSFSFGVEREMKESGEKGGTE
jgi:hypothetical protein